MERMGNSGTQGTLKPRGRSGWVRRSRITPKETSTKANSVPMLERSAASPISTSPEGRPTARPAIQVDQCGVLKRGWTREKNVGQQAVARHGEPDARLAVLEDQQRAQHAHQRADDDDRAPDGTRVRAAARRRPPAPRRRRRSRRREYFIMPSSTSATPT